MGISPWAIGSGSCLVTQPAYPVIMNNFLTLCAVVARLLHAGANACALTCSHANSRPSDRVKELAESQRRSAVVLVPYCVGRQSPVGPNLFDSNQLPRRTRQEPN